MQKKFLRTFAISVLSLIMVATTNISTTYAMDDDEFEEFEEIVLQQVRTLTCHMKWRRKNTRRPTKWTKIDEAPLGYGQKHVRYEVTHYKNDIDFHRARYCRRCNAESHVYPEWKQLPYVNLEKGEIYQKLHITDNEAARAYICRKPVPSSELRELMTRAKIPPGTFITMKDAIERLWRATRPANINYRVETVEYVDGIKQIDELTPLITTECDVLVLQKIIDPPVVETKTTSCCCSIS